MNCLTAPGPTALPAVPCAVRLAGLPQRARPFSNPVVAVPYPPCRIWRRTTGALCRSACARTAPRAQAHITPHAGGSARGAGAGGRHGRARPDLARCP